MTTDELNTIVAAVVAELEKSGVDFDYKAKEAKDDDLVFVIRGTAPDYQGVTVTWKGLLDIITSQATQAKNDAVTAKNSANTILEQVKSNGTAISNFVATSKTDLETQKNESVNAVKSVYQTDLNELKGDLNELDSRLSESIVEISDIVKGTSNFSESSKLKIDGTEIRSSEFNTSEPINVNGYTSVIFLVAEAGMTASEILYLIEYDANGNKVDHWGTNASRLINLNNNTSYVRFSFVKGFEGVLYNGLNTSDIIYKAQKNPNIDERVSVIESETLITKNELNELLGFAPNLLCDFCYPKDTNFDVYTKSMVLNGNEQGFGDYTVQRVGNKFTINSSDTGRKNYEHFVFNADMTKYISTYFEIYWKMKNANTKKLLVIGDSTIAGGQVVTAMRDAYGSNMTLIGTKGNGIYKHCGIGGWRATDFYEKPYRGTDTSDTNPFYNPSTEHFDLGYYLSQNNLETPTHIIIQLGINDVTASLKPDYTMLNINSYISSMQGIINNIKSFNSDIDVYVNLIIPPSTKIEHYDAYKAGYLSPQIAMWNDAMAIIALKENLTNVKGFIPINAVIDRDTDLGDRVHPNNSGYSKIGVFLANCMASV